MKDDEENWRSFYRKTHELRKDFADRGWETIKTYLILSSIVITVYSGLLALERIQTTFLRFFWLLPLFLTVISLFFWLNFKRECERMYEQIAILTLVEERLGIFVEREKREVFSNERYYLPEVMVKPDKTSIKDFVKDQMKKRLRFYGILKYLFFGIPCIFWVAVLIQFIFGSN